MKRFILMVLVMLSVAGMVLGGSAALSKDVVELKIAVLETNEGKAAFVAEKVAEIDAVLVKVQPKTTPKGTISMHAFLTLTKTIIVKDPNSIVVAEVKKLQAELAVLESALMVIEPNGIEEI
jgi:hypothetical protein